MQYGTIVITTTFWSSGYDKGFLLYYPYKGTRKRHSILLKFKKYIYIFERNLSETLNL